MALIITPGPVPSDGTRIVVEATMTAFIQGTDFTNFGPEEFEGEPVSFVISQTDAPSTDSRTRGTFWFARGDGHMYKWTPEPVRDGNWAPSEAGTNITEFHWVSLSDRKEVMVRCRHGWDAGYKVRGNTQASEWKAEVATAVDGVSRYTLICASTAGSNPSWNAGSDFANAAFMTHAALMDPVFIATTDATDGQYSVVVDCGFVDALVSGPGANGTEPALAWHDSAQVEPHYSLIVSDSSAATNTLARVAFVAESAASAAQQELQVLMMQSISNLVKPQTTDLFLAV
jgi:hypothetical protein